MVAELAPGGELTWTVAAGVSEWSTRAVRRAVVDMPIGLFEGGRVRARACDRAARERLGPRRSSVFAPPTRDMLGAADHGPLGARGLSIQAFHLLPKIAELDAALEPGTQGRVVEGHPELAFARLAGAPLADSKRTAAGRQARRALLECELDRPLEDLDRFLASTRRRDVAVDDALDALVLALVARDLERGRAARLPAGDPPLDARGLRMEVWG